MQTTLNELISLQKSDIDSITALDVKSYLLSLNMNPEDIDNCLKTFLSIHKLNHNEFQELIKEKPDVKQWYGEMYGYIYQHKKETELKKINLLLPGFETDIKSYTDNKKLIEHFTNGFRLVWLSFTDSVKRDIVLAFNGQFPNDKTNNYTDKPKTSTEVKIDNILKNRKENKDMLSNFEEEPIPTYNDNETVIDYAKKENKEAVVSDEFDIDSLFVD